MVKSDSGSEESLKPVFNEPKKYNSLSVSIIFIQFRPNVISIDCEDEPRSLSKANVIFNIIILVILFYLFIVWLQFTYKGTKKKDSFCN